MHAARPPDSLAHARLTLHNGGASAESSEDDVFRGRYTQRIDSAGHCPVPSPFLEVIRANQGAGIELGGQERPRVVMTTGFERQITVVDPKGFQELEERLAAAVEGDCDHCEAATQFRRLAVDNALPVEIDPQGNVHMPDVLRWHADLTQEVVWAGMGGSVEIWSATVFNRLRPMSRAHKQVLLDRLRELEIG